MTRMGFEPNRRLAKDYHNVRVEDTIGDKHYWFRSKLEHKLAQYLQLMKDTEYIKSWYYENTRFKFPDSSWLVDFMVRNNDNTVEFWEAKGLCEADTKRKIKLLAKYRPEVVITMVFQNKRDMEKFGKYKAFCKRVCLIKELTRGII